MMLKKIIALLMAAMMLLCGVAVAEEETEAIAVEATENLVPELGADELLDFGLAMDAIPAGYSMDVDNLGDVLLAEFRSDEDPDAVIFEVAIAYSEMFAGYTLKYSEMTADQWMEMQELIGENYDSADFTVTQTTHGTDLIVVNENDAQSDVAEIFTIYDGYFISVVCLKLDGEVTEADVATGVQLISDMWVVPAN